MTIPPEYEGDEREEEEDAIPGQFNTYIIVIQRSVCTFSKFELSESRVGAAWHPVSYFHTN